MNKKKQIVKKGASAMTDALKKKGGFTSASA